MTINKLAEILGITNSPKRKKIIVFEGLDGVGKTTLYDEMQCELIKAAHNITYYKGINPFSTISFRFPTTDSPAYNAIKNENSTIPKEQIPDLMLENILTNLRSFYDADIDTAICDRGLFSNYLYNLNETYDQFIERLGNAWNKYFDDYSTFDENIIHEFFDIETRIVTCPETVRMCRLKSRDHLDITETADFQDALKTRYDRILKDPKAIKFFNLPDEYNHIWTTCD